MLEIKEIVKDPNGIEKKLQTKDADIKIGPVISLYEQMCKLKTELDSSRAELKILSERFGEARKKGTPSEELMSEVSHLKKKVQDLEEKYSHANETYLSALAELPNVPEDDIKVSFDPKDNVPLKAYKEKPNFSFPIKNHLEIGKELGLFDFERAAKITGSGWPIYTGLGARLEWALINLMVETHIKNGFTFYLLPHLVRPDVMYGSGQLPKFAKQAYHLEDEDYDLFLIPTAEVPLNGLHQDEILKEEDLPKLYTSYTPCFRREAGAAGKNERGLIRIHQFNKVEMFAYTTPEDSKKIFEKLVRSAEEILEALELHYRSMLLVTGDMSYASARTIDIEVYLPGQERYYEVSSVSNCTDFQARRSKIRYTTKEGKKSFVHTLNGSGLATSRLMVALLENNQNPDGSVNLPKILHDKLGPVLKRTV